MIYEEKSTVLKCCFSVLGWNLKIELASGSSFLLPSPTLVTVKDKAMVRIGDLTTFTGFVNNILS